MAAAGLASIGAIGGMTGNCMERRMLAGSATMLSPDLRQLVESGPLTHLSTINPDGSPQVTVVWLGLDGDDLLTAHMGRNYRKLRNVEREPRVVLSFLAPPEPGVSLAHYAVINATARIEGPTEDAWE